MEEKISRKLVDLAWLAGILDGDGYFSVNTRKAHNDKYYLDVKVRLNNSDVRLIRKASEIFKALGVKFFYSLTNVKNKNWLTCVEIRVDRQKNCYKLLKSLKPYMVSKKGQVDKMLDIIEYVKSVPKGGDTSSDPYVDHPYFKELMHKFNKEFNWHYEPLNVSRKAHKALLYGDTEPIKVLSDEELSWLAGVIDCEGSFYIGDKSTYRIDPYVDVTNTDVRMIQKISQIYEFLNLRFFYVLHNRKKIKESYKNQISLRTTYKGTIVKLLNELKPFLVCKAKLGGILKEELNRIKTCKDENQKQGLKKDCFGETSAKACRDFFEEKKWYQDPQRLIREANSVLEFEDRVRPMPETV